MRGAGDMSIGRLLVGLVLVVFGLSVLFANLGWTEWSFVFALLNLWPLLLIIVGLYLLLGSTRPTLAMILTVLLVLGGVGLAWAERDSARGFFKGPGAVSTNEISGPPAERFEKGNLGVDAGALELNIAGESTGSTARGEFRSRFDPVVASFTHGDTYELKIGQKAGSTVSLPFGWGEENERLDLSLDPNLAWTVDVDVGAADVDIDLEEVLLDRLTLDAGASSTNITIGPRVVEEGATVELDGGAASFTIYLPRSLDITVRNESGLSSDTLDSDFDEVDDDTYFYGGGGSTLSVTVRSGLSSTDVELY